MLKNNNQKAVNNLGISALKQSRSRNFFIILAIVLTTFMFTTVFTVGFSMAKNMNTMILWERGTSAKVFLMNPTAEQIKQVKNCKSLAYSGVTISADIAEKNGVQIAMTYTDEENFTHHITPTLSDISGNYPQKENEIMISLDGLKALGIENPQINMEIPLLIDNAEKSFILSGYFKDYAFRTNTFDAYVSAKYANSIGHDSENFGMLSMSAKKFSEKKLLTELESVELAENQAINSTFDSNESDSNVIAGIVIFICVIILISGFLLIYNIIYISVSRDIRFYGMLKTIGTTSKQIRKIVEIQAFALSAIGIPIGMILGTVVSFVAVPFAVKIFSFGYYSAMPNDMSFSPLIYVGTIIFALVTVALSCRKPAKIAGKVTPVEALKYNGISDKKIKPKTTTDGGKLYKMAYRNVFREKKRVVLVFASMLMGTLTLLATQAFLGCLNADNYSDYYFPDDYAIFPVRYSDDYEIVDKNKVEAAEKLAENIKNIDGITDVMLNISADANIVFDKDLYRPFMEYDTKWTNTTVDEMINSYENGSEFYSPVIGIDSKMLERHNKKSSHPIDVEAFENGEICFVGDVDTQEQAELVTGRKIILESNTGEQFSITAICGLYDDDKGFNLNIYGHSPGAPTCIIVSQKFIKNFTDRPYIDGIIAECEPKSEEKITKQIKNLCENNICVPSVSHIQIKSEIIRDFQSSMMSMNILTAGISIVLILIGVINFVNVMLTGVFTRRVEIAVMESVGMTKKQVRKMLMCEGAYYAIISEILVLTVGNTVIYFIGKNSTKIADYAVFNYPWQLISVLIILIFAVCMIVPAVCYDWISKKSITERLKSSE